MVLFYESCLYIHSSNSALVMSGASVTEWYRRHNGIILVAGQSFILGNWYCMVFDNWHGNTVRKKCCLCMRVCYTSANRGYSIWREPVWCKNQLPMLFWTEILIIGINHRLYHSP